jgi:sulfonate transport system substrate-binding protein
MSPACTEQPVPAVSRRQALLGVAALALSGCAAGGTRRLRIGYQRNGVLFVARSRGVIDKRLAARGITLEWAEFPAGPPLIEAMNAGAIDFGAVGDTPAVYAQAASMPVRLVAATVYAGRTPGAGFLSRRAAPITSSAALQGKRIGFTKGSSAEVAALTALADVGLSIHDVVPVRLAPADGLAALGQGSIDALFTWDPYFTIALARGDVVETRFDRPGVLNVTLFLANRKAPEADVYALLDELRLEAAWANTHRADVVTLLAGATRMAAADIATSLDRLGPAPFRIAPPDAAVIANQQRVADRLLEAGAIPARVDQADFADTSWRPA